jgi:methyl acetate hydrolase
MNPLKAVGDEILGRAVSSAPGVPGVAALVTGREGPLYEGAAGNRTLGQAEAMTVDTVVALFSLTKAITGTAVLQLAEEGLLDLDAPAKKYAPEIGRLQVLTGFSSLGSPKLRAPKRAITTRMLMLHTSGLAYEIFNEVYFKLTSMHGQTRTATASKAALMSPLLFDPGENWEYGSGIDWCGVIVEKQRGKRLGEVMRERIFAPLGMASTGFKLTAPMRARLACVHQRAPNGALVPDTSIEWPQMPEVQMGGHALYGTVEDYGRFIRMWLNDGAGEGGRVLKAETVAMAAKNGLGNLKVKPLKGVIPTLSLDVDFFPGLSKSWGLTFMINDEEAPTGRSAGSLSWCGLGNLYYWIDRKQGIGGVWAAQVLPFVDPACFQGYLAFERAVYDAVKRSA